MAIHPQRIHVLPSGSGDAPSDPGPVVYWMQREQRVQDNWALLYAQQQAIVLKAPLVVVFCQTLQFLGALPRQYAFMLAGLKEARQGLSERNISFHLLHGAPEVEIPSFARALSSPLLVMDFNPLRLVRQWKERIRQTLSIPVHEVDAHNIVPCRVASQKEEYSARTIRGKIQRLLPGFLDDFPVLQPHPYTLSAPPPSSDFPIPKAAPFVVSPGEAAAREHLARFLAAPLHHYAARRNDPNADATSQLSGYFHFGHLAPQRAALETLAPGSSNDNTDAFLEELIVRRELAENFCFYNPRYDDLSGAREWAQETLRLHRGDSRPFVYSLDEFEQGRTHSALWNAAQNQMKLSGLMHGYMRMFWAKKILEWAVSPEEAVRIAVTLNDRYSLDGRDPNGYTGVLWSIAGVHDRAWKERPVYGKIRYMNENGCRRKFDVDAYIRRWGESPPLV